MEMEKLLDDYRVDHIGTITSGQEDRQEDKREKTRIEMIKTSREQGKYLAGCGMVSPSLPRSPCQPFGSNNGWPVVALYLHHRK
jgi:hypothetical protein